MGASFLEGIPFWGGKRETTGGLPPHLDLRPVPFTLHADLATCLLGLFAFCFSLLFFIFCFQQLLVGCAHFWRVPLLLAASNRNQKDDRRPPTPFGCGSKFNRQGKPQVLVHVSTYRSGKPFWNSGYLSHSHFGARSRGLQRHQGPGSAVRGSQGGGGSADLGFSITKKGGNPLQEAGAFFWGPRKSVVFEIDLSWWFGLGI